jgi:hypothetical protein
MYKTVVQSVMLYGAEAKEVNRKDTNY